MYIIFQHNTATFLSQSLHADIKKYSVTKSVSLQQLSYTFNERNKIKQTFKIIPSIIIVMCIPQMQASEHSQICTYICRFVTSIIFTFGEIINCINMCIHNAGIHLVTVYSNYLPL